MKIRRQLRNGWHLVELDIKVNPNRKANLEQYIAVHRWCENTFAKDKWRASFVSDLTTTKKFVFENERDKTLFMLKWL